MPQSRTTRTISIQIRHEDYEWLESEARSSVYCYPSTLARYLLAEKISEKRGKEISSVVPEDEGE